MDTLNQILNTPEGRMPTPRNTDGLIEKLVEKPISQILADVNIEKNRFKGFLDVRFRCPSCEKLYTTSADVFEGESPEFDCIDCHKPFTLSKELNDFGLYQTISGAVSNLVECPNCTKLKPAENDECPSCGIYVSKFLERQKVDSPSLFELNQLWQKVIEDFQNDEKHQTFINKCQERSALSFSFQKYDLLKKTLGFDEICERYLMQIELRLSEQLRKQYIVDSDIEKKNNRRTLTQVVFAVVTVLGVLVLIYNKLNQVLPNLTGLIVAITVLSFGLFLISTQRTPLR